MSTVELYRYKAADVLQFAQLKHEELETLHQEPSSMSELTFRDEGGAYWTVYTDRMIWHRHHHGRWRRSDPPGGVLEAPFSPAISILPPRLPEHGEVEAPTSNVVDLLERITRRAREGYKHGRFTSTIAEALVKGVVAIDREGSACAVGIHSGDWYSFKTENWRKTTRPDPATLKDLVSKELGLPEPVTNPWSPPAILRQKITEPTPSKTVGPQFCVGCGSPLAAGQMFCKKCGKQVTSTTKPVTRRTRPHLPATRNLLIGIFLSVLVSASFTYMYYLVAGVKLNPLMSLGSTFILSLLIAFAFFSFSLREQRSSAASENVQPVETPVIVQPSVKSGKQRRLIQRQSKEFYPRNSA